MILSPLSSTSRVLKIGMQSDTLTQTELTTLALWTIRPRLMAIPGVANVAVWGQRERQFQVRVDPQRLLAHGVTLDEVIASAGEATSAAGGAFIDRPNQRLSVTHLPAVRSADDLARIVVAHSDGSSLTLGEVADIVEGSPPPIGDAIINDEPGILLIVEKQPWGNTLEVTREVEAVLDDLRPALAGVDVDPTIFRPATYIENAVANLNTALLIGCVLVIVILSVFLYDWRAALISIVAIPLSLITAALVMNYTGGTIDTMVLAGLIIALGEVVDDAIIDVENIMRRLRRNRAAGNPESVFSVVLKASLEVRSAVVFGSLIVALVLVPVLTLEGLSGAFFRPLALAYIVAILASLGVALTLTPALALILLPKAAERRAARLAARALAQDTLSTIACAAHSPTTALPRDRRRRGARSARDLPFARAGAAAELSRIRLPDALARAAGHVTRRDESHDDASEPRAALGRRCAELRRARRPRRGRR